jgi:hypothetical protein
MAGGHFRQAVQWCRPHVRTPEQQLVEASLVVDSTPDDLSTDDGVTLCVREGKQE